MEKIKYFCHLRVIIQKNHVLKMSCNHNRFILFLGLVMIALLQACSVNNNKLSNRFYHNLSAHYNGYWNGKESYNEGLRLLKSRLQNNYSEILPVFNYGNEQDAIALAPYMERAVQKASVVIQRHSMRFQNKEYNRWVDDAYLLIGKAYFYQGEYVSARRTFEFMIDEFKSTASSYEAMLWLVRTYNQMGQFEKSKPLLERFQELIDYENVSLSSQREYPLVYSNFYLMQKKYTESVEFLNNSIEINNHKQLVTRLKYILAQVYFKLGNMEAASDLFAQVVHRNPDYDMAFNARINMARSFFAGADNADEIIKSLKNLLNDSKNKEFKDQIYFVLAEISLKENNLSAAINYLVNSVAESTNNNFQKVEACLNLASLYFEGREYTNAKLYYDTAMQVIPLNYPDYKVLKDRTNILVSLVGYLETIQLQDSLQSLSRMSESDRTAIIDAQIASVTLREKDIQVEERQQMQDLSTARQNAFSQTNQRNGAWYFYNPSTLSFGFTEFVSKWGRRSLEDNWRLSHKQAVTERLSEDINQAEILNQAISAETGTVLSPKDRDYYLKDIPLTEEQLLQSDKIIIEALFQSAMLFKEGLQDTTRAIRQFEILINSYPENEYIIQSYYYLHRLYAPIDNNKSTRYKQYLLTQFPNSDYTKVLINPEYFRNLSVQKTEIESLYFNTYQAYENEQYYVSISLSDQAIANYTDSLLIPKFEYIKALSIGRIEVIDSLVVGMQRIVDKYPKSEVAPLAQNLINYYNSENIPAGRIPQTLLPVDAEAFGDYNFQPNTNHLYILIINSERVNLNAVKLRLSDFNLKRTFTKPLTIANMLINEDSNWLTVIGFGNMQEAKDYISDLETDEYVLSIFNLGEYSQFVISEDNYVILLRDKNISEYLRFYYKYYQTTN